MKNQRPNPKPSGKRQTDRKLKLSKESLRDLSASRPERIKAGFGTNNYTLYVTCR
jgi:hypothetical protein